MLSRQTLREGCVVLTLSTGIGITGDLGSSGFNLRNRVDMDVSLPVKSLLVMKDFVGAILVDACVSGAREIAPLVCEEV